MRSAGSPVRHSRASPTRASRSSAPLPDPFLASPVRFDIGSHTTLQPLRQTPPAEQDGTLRDSILSMLNTKAAGVAQATCVSPGRRMATPKRPSALQTGLAQTKRFQSDHESLFKGMRSIADRSCSAASQSAFGVVATTGRADGLSLSISPAPEPQPGAKRSNVSVNSATQTEGTPAKRRRKQDRSSDTSVPQVTGQRSVAATAAAISMTTTATRNIASANARPAAAVQSSIGRLAPPGPPGQAPRSPPRTERERRRLESRRLVATARKETKSRSQGVMNTAGRQPF